jgi:hypothetical protein
VDSFAFQAVKTKPSEQKPPPKKPPPAPTVPKIKSRPPPFMFYNGKLPDIPGDNPEDSDVDPLDAFR